jgi:hypothetical protein
MGRHGGVIAAAVAVFVSAGVLHADMMSVSNLETGANGGYSATSTGDSPQLTPAELPFTLPELDAWISYSIALQAEAIAEETVEAPNPQILVDRSNSLDLCLYALVSLGVFRSGQWVKRSSLGFVPEWYHSGAPLQIGHSHAVGPDAFCFAAVCFVQPDCGVDPHIPPRRHGIITSLWRCSQFTPSVPSTSVLFLTKGGFLTLAGVSVARWVIGRCCAIPFGRGYR